MPNISCQFCNNQNLNCIYENELTKSYKCIHCNVIYYFDNYFNTITLYHILSYKYSQPANEKILNSFIKNMSVNNIIPIYIFSVNLILDKCQLFEIKKDKHFYYTDVIYENYEILYNITPSNFDKKLTTILTFL
jgi:hypothetical protein